jgi:Flp pilus assembly pilin Flp
MTDAIKTAIFLLKTDRKGVTALEYALIAAAAAAVILAAFSGFFTRLTDFLNAIPLTGGTGGTTGN